MKELLLIEDNERYRKSVVALFKGEGYRFEEAPSPEKGIAILKNNPQIRVILLDLYFPNANATAAAVLEYIKQFPDNYRLIVLTGHSELLLSEQAEGVGVFNNLPKDELSTSQAIRFSVQQAFRDLERARLDRKVRALLKVQTEVVAGRNVEEALDLICQSIRNTVEAYTCHIRVYDFNRGDYRLAGFAGGDGVRQVFEGPKIKGRSFSGIVAKTGKPITEGNVQNHPDFQRQKEAALSRTDISPEERVYWESVRAARVVPISTPLFGGLVDAVININSQTVDFFDEEKCALIDEFATLAAIAISKDWLQKKREEIHDDNSQTSEMLSEISRKLRGLDVLKGIYEVVIRSVAKIVNAEVVSIFLFNDATGLIENVAELQGDELLEDSKEVYRPGECLTGFVFETNEIIHSPLPSGHGAGPLQDTRFDISRLDQYLKGVPSGRIEHYLGVPIRMGGRVRGVLRAINKKSDYYGELGSHDPMCLLERGFSRDCRNVMTITASHLAVAVRNAELLREREDQVDQLTMLGEVGAIINSALHINQVLKLTIKKMKEVMDAEICMLFLKDGVDRIVLKECFGMPFITDAFYKIGEGVTGKVAATGEPVLLINASENNGKYDAEIRAFLNRDIDSLMVVPIIAKNSMIGVMKVINKKDKARKYNAHDLKLFRTFASYVSVAISNAQIYSTLSQFVKAVAHEINNTSGVIPANIISIKRLLGPANNKEVNHSLELIADAAQQATDFANEIAGFSATRTGEKVALDINEVVQSAIRALRSDLLTHEASETIRLEESISHQSLICEINRTPFIQIVRNIVINALQALNGKKGGVIHISTREGVDKTRPTAVIEIKDNGPGIKEEYIHRIFEADFTTKRSSGVGLWLVQTQLESLGGRIDVESKLGKGATFKIQIPISGARAGEHV